MHHYNQSIDTTDILRYNTEPGEPYITLNSDGPFLKMMGENDQCPMLGYHCWLGGDSRNYCFIFYIYICGKIRNTVIQCRYLVTDI